MSMFTDAEGGSCTVKDADHKYGPYLKKNTLPNNPITEIGAGITELAISTSGDLLMGADATPAGWKFDVLTGKFIANDAAYEDH